MFTLVSCFSQITVAVPIVGVTYGDINFTAQRPNNTSQQRTIELLHPQTTESLSQISESQTTDSLSQISESQTINLLSQMPELLTQAPYLQTQIPELQTTEMQTQRPELQTTEIQTQIPELQTTEIQTTDIQTQIPELQTTEIQTQRPELQTQIPELQTTVIQTQIPELQTLEIQTQIPELQTTEIQTQIPELQTTEIQTQTTELFTDSLELLSPTYDQCPPETRPEETVCDVCECQTIMEGQLGWVCIHGDCFEPQCADSIAVPGECCRVCPNGHNCMVDNHLIPFHVTHVMPDGRECHCVYNGEWESPEAVCTPPKIADLSRHKFILLMLDV